MASKGPEVYIQILANFFFIPSIENIFDDKEVIFQEENESFHRKNGIKTFL